MAWYAPNDCEETCCEPPCTPPVITCRKYESVYGGGFEYSVTGADYAWITETCGEVVTIHEVTLVDGDASGTFPTTEGCTYCIRARDGDCEAACCDVCDTPTCTLAVTRNLDGDLVIVYSYNSNSETDLIVSAKVGGIDVFTGFFPEFVGSGTLTVPISSLTLESATYSGVMFHDLVLTVTNDCGKVAKCRFIVPCCWEMTQTRVSISGLSDTFTETIDSVTRSIGSGSQFNNKHSMRVTGLASLNGTHFLDNSIPQFPFARGADTCDTSLNYVEIGTITVTQKITANGRDFFILPARDWDYTLTYEIKFTVYLGSPINTFVPPGLNGYWGGIYLEYASGTFEDLLVYHPNGTSPGFSVPRSFSGCSQDGSMPLTAPCSNDGFFNPYTSGIGFFGTAVPSQSDGGMTGIQHQPAFVCRQPQTRDFYAPSRFASIGGVLSMAFNGGLTDLHCPIHQVIFPDAVELEYV